MKVVDPSRYLSIHGLSKQLCKKRERKKKLSLWLRAGSKRRKPERRNEKNSGNLNFWRQTYQVGPERRDKYAEMIDYNTVGI